MKNNKKYTENGSSLLGIIALMLLISILGTALLINFSTSSEQVLIIDSGNQAFFMSESGARYAITKIVQDEKYASELNGSRFLIGNNGFELNIESNKTADYSTNYYIDSIGISNAGSVSERRCLNGYAIEILNVKPIISFNYAIFLTESSGFNALRLTGSSYIDSYNSKDPLKNWVGKGVYRDADVITNLNNNVADFSWSTFMYGDLFVGNNANLNNLSSIVSMPNNNIKGQIEKQSQQNVKNILPPTETLEMLPPSFLVAFPSFTTYGNQTVYGGNYIVQNNFSVGSANLTITNNVYIKTVGNFNVSNGGFVTSNYDFSCDVGGNMNIEYKGLSVKNCDLQIKNDLIISSNPGMVVNGKLDLDVGRNLEVDRNGKFYIGDDSDIDVSGYFHLHNSAELFINKKVILRVGNGIIIDGNSSIIFSSEGSMEIYVNSGIINIANSSIINPSFIASRFLIVGNLVSDVYISGNSTIYSGIFTPMAEVKVENSCSIFGAVICKNLLLSGNSSLHYDQALQGISNGSIEDFSMLRRFWIISGN